MPVLSSPGQWEYLHYILIFKQEAIPLVCIIDLYNASLAQWNSHCFLQITKITFTFQAFRSKDLILSLA